MLNVYSFKKVQTEKADWIRLEHCSTAKQLNDCKLHFGHLLPLKFGRLPMH